MPADKVSKTSNRFVPYDLARRPLHTPLGNHQGKAVRSAGAVDLSQYYRCQVSNLDHSLAQDCPDSIGRGFLLYSPNGNRVQHCYPDGTVSGNIGADYNLCDPDGGLFCREGSNCIGLSEQTFQDVCTAVANNTCPTAPPIEPSTTFLPSTPPPVGTDLTTTNNIQPSMSPTAIAGMSVAFPITLAIGITVVAVCAGVATTVIIYKRIRDKIMGSADVTHDVVQWSTTGGARVIDNQTLEEADKVANALKNSGSLASSEPNNDLDAPQHAVIDGQHITFKNLDSKEETV